MASLLRFGRREEDGALLTRIPTVDDVLSQHAMALRDDFVGYRNHVYRVVNLCAAIAGGSELEKIAVAAVFHDLGIWTDGTFDYIAPSIALAHEYLAARAREDWIPGIEAMIADHHKITPSSADPDSLIEAFRRADWIDVTRGLRAFGIPRPFVTALFATWPSAGFHWRLVTLTLDRFRSHPLTPLPMVRL
jgi:HD domain-containing protein